MGNVTNIAGQEMTLTPPKRSVDVYDTLDNSEGAIMTIPTKTGGHAIIANAVNSGVMNFILLI